MKMVSGNITNVSLLPAWAPYRDVFIVVDSLLILPICFGNILVLAAYMTNRELQTVANLPLVNMAIADLMTGVVSIPMTCYQLYVYRLVYNKFVCLSFLFSIMVSVNVSILSILTITVMRFVTVNSPIRYKTFITKFRIKCVLGVVWAYKILLTLSFLVAANPFNKTQPVWCLE